MTRARNFADLIKNPKGAPVTVASSGNVTLDLSGNNSFFDAGTTTAATAVTFGTPDTTTKRFTYSFIPGYDNSASSVDDMDTWHFDSSMGFALTNNELKIYNSDGTKMYTLDTSGDALITYNLAIPFDDTSESFDNKIYLGTGTASVYGTSLGNIPAPGVNLGNVTFMTFNNDGSKLLMGGTFADAVVEFHLSTPYDTSSGSISYDSQFSIAGEDTAPYALTFNPDGTKMFLSGGTGNDINTYSLSTGFDVSTASFVEVIAVSNFTNAPTYNTDIRNMFFNSDGTKMFFNRNAGILSAIEQADLSTAYDLSTATYSSKFFNLQIHSQHGNAAIPYASDQITLDRTTLAPTINGRIERGTSFHPTFSTSFTGYPTFFSRGYRHNLEFQTTDGGSSYQLLNHNKVQV